MTTTQSNYSPERDQQTLGLFQRFLKVQSTSHSGPSSGSYAQAVALLEEEARKRGFSTSQREMVPGKPILLCSLHGKNESAQSILLNSHYDVVPGNNINFTKIINQ
jgi:acetylornithine deacetylase/succinyl-diaminopimelate desuccinylase-like protein